MKFTISCAFLVMVLGFAVVSISAGVPSGWEVGSYWTYQQVERVQSAADIPMGTITYYVVARTELLYTAMCALTRVDKSLGEGSIISPLTVHVLEPGSLQPQVWPFPAQAAPIMIVREKGAMLGEGGSQMTETMYREGEGALTQQFSVQQGGVQKVTVPAGVFPNALRFEYQEKVIVPANTFPSSRQSPGQYSWQAEGTAWWSSDVAGWVQIEGHGQGSHPGGYADTHYTLVLSDWGRLSKKDLQAGLSAALTDTSSFNPVMAEVIGRQFQEIGFDLDNGG